MASTERLVCEDREVTHVMRIVIGLMIEGLVLDDKVKAEKYISAEMREMRTLEMH